ncbi:MAG: triose-phosphate isomerase [Pseudomonadota bacterium]
MHKPIWLIGNWKMHGNKAMIARFAAQLAQRSLPDASIRAGLCVPAPLIEGLADRLAETKLLVGAQHCSAFAPGALTGEIAAALLAELGASLVIIGHSERRQHFHETGAMIAASADQAIKAGLQPIICLGEDRAAYEEGRTLETVALQLEALLDFAWDHGPWMLAYEPVWAIGTNMTAQPSHAQTVHHFLRQKLATHCGTMIANQCPILYGGSMNRDTMAGLLAQHDVDGGLIGTASLDLDHFCAMLDQVK